jgi:hypothetical protein
VTTTISMLLIGKDDPMVCLSCPTPSTDGQPIVLIISDQTFLQVLRPTGKGNCIVIIRVEDKGLWVLEEVFSDTVDSDPAIWKPRTTNILGFFCSS